VSVQLTTEDVLKVEERLRTTADGKSYVTIERLPGISAMGIDLEQDIHHHAM